MTEIDITLGRMALARAQEAKLAVAAPVTQLKEATVWMGGHSHNLESRAPPIVEMEKSVRRDLRKFG